VHKKEEDMRGKLYGSKSLWAPLLAAGVLVLAGGAAYAAQPPPMPVPKVSEANRVNLKEAQEALNARRYSEVVAKSNAALANPAKTRDDVFAAHSFLFNAARAQGDSAGMMKAMEGQIESGFLPPALVNLQYRNLIGIAYQQKDFHKVVEYGQQLIKAGDTGADVYKWVGQGYYELKDYAAAVRFFDGIVSDKEKRGQRPSRDELILLQSSYTKAGKKDAAQATLEKVVRYYPDASTWLALLYEVKRERLEPRQQLQLSRLLEATGNLKQGPEFMDYANAALAANLHAESQRVLEAGLKANVFPVGIERGRAERYVKSAALEAGKARNALPKLEADAKAAPTGDKYVALGMTLFSFGEYGKAVPALQAGIAKGGLRAAPDARMALGIAQVKAGQKAEALKTFRTVKFDDELSQRIAQLWALYAT
jgi:TolA-binding protein